MRRGSDKFKTYQEKVASKEIETTKFPLLYVNLVQDIKLHKWPEKPSVWKIYEDFQQSQTEEAVSERNTTSGWCVIN
jgi:hypothetical protein